MIRNSKYNILKALFDIKPVDDSGRVDFQKIYKLQTVVNLAPVKKNSEPPLSASDKFFFGVWDDDGVKDLGVIDYKAVKEKVVSRKPVQKTQKPKIITSPQVFPQVDSAEDLTEQFGPELTAEGLSRKSSLQAKFEVLLSQSLDVKEEIKSIGGKTVSEKKAGKPRYHPIFAKQKSGDDYQVILSQINQRVAPEVNEVFVGEPKKIDPISLGILPEARPVVTSPEIESWIRYTKSEAQSPTGVLDHARESFPSRLKTSFKIRIPKLSILTTIFKRRNLLAVGILGFSAIIFASFGQYGINVKNEVVKESDLAVANLEQANESLKVFDFETASNNFAEAYEEFSKAGDSLDFMGASITSLFAELPGAGKLKSAKNLVEAGKLLAEAGKSMSKAVSSLSQTGTILKLTTSDVGATVNIQNIFSNLKKSLTASNRNLSKANVLLLDVDPDDLPEDKRESFFEFQSKLPEMENVISDAVEYTGFLENLLGSNGAYPSLSATAGTAKKYLILFQNDSELRPTGGFPGTYAVVTFKDGRLAGFLVDDVYNLDGQLKENIIPPRPLQHITPNWGMRDANWFIDFSVSAQKVMEFFKKEAGYQIDGVITMSPRMISDILKVVGPIEMPEYGLIINDKNFLSTIQAEVEYGDNRQQPKKVVVDMAPKLLEKIYSSDPGQWLDIFHVFVSGLDRKDILMYFKDLSLESFVAEKGFGGLVKNYAEDYLMVTLTNVKGSKTDKVTDNSIKVGTRFEENPPSPEGYGRAGRIIHKLEITRQHNGGSAEYGFYNKQNPAYVRVLVPEEAELLSISGNSNPEFKPLISYSGGDFKRDDDLFKLESSFYFDDTMGVATYRESGKKGFAFWLVTDPGQTETVELEYAVPFILNGAEGVESDGDSYGIYIQKQPGLDVDNFEFQVGNTYIYNGEFDKDLELRFKIE